MASTRVLAVGVARSAGASAPQPRPIVPTKKLVVDGLPPFPATTAGEVVVQQHLPGGDAGASSTRG